MNIKQYIAKMTANMSSDYKVEYAFRLTRNLMVHEVVGWPPLVLIHHSAWTQLKNHTLDYMNKYFDHYKKLPTGLHNVGHNFFPSIITTVDFTELTNLLYNDMQHNVITDYPDWVRQEVKK